MPAVLLQRGISGRHKRPCALDECAKFAFASAAVMETPQPTGYTAATGAPRLSRTRCSSIPRCVLKEVVMGFFDFIKEAGEKLFHGSAAAPADASADADAAKAADDAKGQAIQDYIAQQGLSATALSVQVEGDAAKVFGVAPDQATREKIILCCGNVEGIKAVDDQMSVNTESEESQWHTVERGDTLSAIAKKFYGDANKYPTIFEANKPMLSDPDKIYPGQKLRIPAA